MIQLLEKTKSTYGREIELFVYEGNKVGKTVLIIGVFHGDEPQGETLINRFIKENQCIPKNKMLFIPCLNPDGKALNTRQNANGIDLNRNFPTKNRKIIEDEHYFGGNKPSSETETCFIIDVLEKYKPDFILTLHTPYKVVNYDGPAQKQAEIISKITGYPVSEDIGYETPGSFGTYAGKERKIPTITLELADDETDEELWNNVKGIFDFCMNEL
ncbi:MAG: M14 family murein peptide amidase A [Candidatus Gastranaerophilaceae bacterium]